MGLSKNPITGLRPVLTDRILSEIRDQVEKIYVDEKIKDYIIKVVNGTRPETAFSRRNLKVLSFQGASPRASIWLYQVSKFKAFMEGKEFVTPENVISIVQDIIGHRIILSYEAMVDKVSSREIALRIANALV